MVVKDLIDKVDTSALMLRSLADWHTTLSEECQCYACKGGYLVKRFNEINYSFCSKEEAKEVLIDNLYFILKYKYFPSLTDEILERITKIVNSFTTNIKSVLKEVTFDNIEEDEMKLLCQVKYLPAYCIAFNNGVFDFKNNKWFFKYDIINVEKLSSKIYQYDTKYIITWHLNYEFEPLGFNILSVPIEDFIRVMKESTKDNKNYCFELLYNMSHDKDNHFDLNRFKHLCEILGYSMLQPFTQYFVLLIGSGQNGKNSLFDGCFTSKVIPTPASIDMETIENDKFITGALENHAHNIFLETDGDTLRKSKVLKNLTGSLYQSIEDKGVSKHSGIINCKYIFAGNDRSKIKFSDTTIGFQRRINLFEIYYRWDAKKKYLKLGDYYDTSFSSDLHEIINNKANSIIYTYFAMYGILSATNDFTSSFKFNYNEFSTATYGEINEEIKDKVNNIKMEDFGKTLSSKDSTDKDKLIFIDTSTPLKNSPILKSLGFDNSIDGLIKMLSNEEAYTNFFNDNEFYISIRFLQSMIGNVLLPLSFTQQFKKTFSIEKLYYLYANKPYVKCTFIGNKFKPIN